MTQRFFRENGLVLNRIYSTTVKRRNIAAVVMGGFRLIISISMLRATIGFSLSVKTVPEKHRPRPAWAEDIAEDRRTGPGTRDCCKAQLPPGRCGMTQDGGRVDAPG